MVIAKGAKADAAQAAGADYVGAEELIAKIQNENWFDYDVIVAAPDMMAQLGKIGRVLGPKGLMPNPKSGTVTMDVAKAINDVKAGKVEYRADKQGIIHVPLGKMKFSADDLMKNFATLADAVIKAKPSGNIILKPSRVIISFIFVPKIELSFSIRSLINDNTSFLYSSFVCTSVSNSFLESNK